MTNLSRLTALETTIASGMQTFLDVGHALKTIRDERLYRDGYKSFEEYAKERWGWGKAHAYRMIQVAEVDQTIGLQVGDAAKPKAESHFREVAKAHPSKQAAVVQSVAAKAAEENREPTAKDYKAAVDGLEYEDCDTEGEDAFDVEAVEKSKREGKFERFDVITYDAKVIKAWTACDLRLGTLRHIVGTLTETEKQILKEWLE